MTGASGFIGKHLLDSLTKRGNKIYCLVYPPAVADFKANVLGTRNACRLAEGLDATLHYTSSTAVAGDYVGFLRSLGSGRSATRSPPSTAPNGKNAG